MTFTLIFLAGQSIFPKTTVSARAGGAADVGEAGGGVLAVAVGRGAGVVLVGSGVAVRVGAGVLVAVGEALRVAVGPAVGEVVAGGVSVGVGSVVEEASEVLFPPVKAGITIRAPITKKIAAMITLTGCIPAPPESIA
ncbi:hypothetical protein [Actinocorallia populi]|uniref:hypothetical protein n=1 Tax=Actinocorallia populi TaxID=2079200 RepID=UPI000D089C19|nr:hypothetical protein [Actinocorallia populi]